MEVPVPPMEESNAPSIVDELTPKSVETGDLLVSVLMNERDQALVDLQSWKVALTALLGELIQHEMPISKLATYVAKVQSDMQHELQYGTPMQYPGALAAAADLVGKIEHAADWRRASWENEKKKRSGAALVERVSSPRRKGRV